MKATEWCALIESTNAIARLDATGAKAPSDVSALPPCQRSQTVRHWT
jgi:hypothetical protein